MPPHLLLCCLLLLWPLQSNSQTLDFWVQKTCVKTEQMKTKWSRNPYSIVGCNMTMVCEYRTPKNCGANNDTFLSVKRCRQRSNCTEDVSNVVVRESTTTDNCSLTVDFINATRDMSGEYSCMILNYSNQSLPEVFRNRDIQIGYVPNIDPKDDISIVYNPIKQIDIILNTRNYSQVFSDARSRAEWIVYASFGTNYRPLLRCDPELSDIYCVRLREPRGQCSPCIVKLDNYAGWGQFNYQGNIAAPLKIQIKVNSIFGEANFTTERSLLEWVKPDPVEISDDSSDYATIFSPRSMDEYHLSEANRRLQKSQSCQFMLHYKLTVLGVEKQGLSYQKNVKLGYIRNVEDDKIALQNVKYFLSNTVLKHCWNISNTCNETTRSSLEDAPNSKCMLNIKLPFPALLYRLNVSWTSRYASDHVSKIVRAGEAAPLVGPVANEARVLCLVQVYDDECTKCLVYFKDIPLPWRGGIIHNYTLTVEPVGGSKLCKWDTNQTVVMNEGSNTFVVSHITPGATYNGTLVGCNAKGESPPSALTIRVPTTSSSLGAPRLLVVERNESRYVLTWADGEKKRNGTYFVHYCYASLLGTAAGNFEYQTAEQFIRCKTNIVTNQVLVGSKNIGSFENISGYYIDLKPTFFVSMIAQDGWSSGLVGVDCYFTKGKSPKEPHQLKIEKPDEDPRSLIVSFSLPCGSNLEYPYGRPSHYYLQIVKMGVDMDAEHAVAKCLNTCKNWSASNSDNSPEAVPLGNDTNFKKDIVQQRSNLDVSTTYCVGVSLGTRWTCQSARTRSENSGKTVMLALAVSIPLLLTLVVGTLILKGLCVLKKRYSKLARKFCKMDLTAMFQPTHELEMAKEKHLRVEAVSTSFNREMEVQIPRDNRIFDARDLVEALLLESSESSASLLTTSKTDLSSSTSAHTEDECTNEQQSNSHVPFSRYSSQQPRPEAHREEQQGPYSSQLFREKEEENESSSSPEEEIDEAEVEERSLSLFQSQESHPKMQEEDLRQFTRYSSHQPQQDEAIEEKEEEKEEIKEGAKGNDEEPEEPMPFDRYASQLCDPHPQDRQGTAALLSAALDHSIKHTDNPNLLCGEFTLPLSVEVVSEMSQLRIQTGNSRPGHFGTQLLTNNNGTSQSLPLQCDLSSTDIDVEDILKAVTGHQTAFLFPNPVQGKTDAHGCSGLASLNTGDDKTHDQSTVHPHDHDTDAETCAVSTKKVESHVFENRSMLDVRDTRNTNEGDSETEIEDILQAAAAAGEVQLLLTHNVRRTQPSIQLPKNKPGFWGKDELFVESNSIGNTDRRSKLSQNNPETCSIKLFNTSYNENDVNAILLAAEGHKPCNSSFNYPPTTNRDLEESEINNILHKTDSFSQSTMISEETKTSSIAPLAQTTLETNKLKQYDKALELSALTSELKYCDENIPQCTETTIPGVFMSVQYADLFKTVLKKDLDGSLENILIAAEASNLPKTDLLCAPMDWPTNRQSSLIDSCSEQDSQYCTSGVECESECESAKESSDSSTEGSTSDLSAFLKSKPLRKPAKVRNKVPTVP